MKTILTQKIKYLYFNKNNLKKYLIYSNYYLF